jgi:hypothetical protein
MGNENMAIHNNSFTKSNCANHRRIPRRTIREGFSLNDYINDLLQRFKKCQQCQTPFIDFTKPQNAKFCSKKCQWKHERQKQTTKIRRHRYYLRKIKPTRLFLKQKCFIGTITKKDLDRHIQKLISLCPQN